MNQFFELLKSKVRGKSSEDSSAKVAPNAPITQDEREMFADYENAANLPLKNAGVPSL